jgi:hypothetical protein
MAGLTLTGTDTISPNTPSPSAFICAVNASEMAGAVMTMAKLADVPTGTVAGKDAFVHPKVEERASRS